jgi:2-oxoglutarate ferredoxin oxidoreductase subunit delta
MFVCPKDLFEPSENMNSSGYLPPRMKDLDPCTGCRNCMLYCPDMAIVVEKEESQESEKGEVPS